MNCLKNARLTVNNPRESRRELLQARKETFKSLQKLEREIEEFKRDTGGPNPKRVREYSFKQLLALQDKVFDKFAT
ncbi:hypothetical protein NBRC116597_30870 [Phaeobacter sp. NW0010-22]